MNLLEFISGLEILFGFLMVNLCTLRIFVGLVILCNMMFDMPPSSLINSKVSVK